MKIMVVMGEYPQTKENGAGKPCLNAPRRERRSVSALSKNFLRPRQRADQRSCRGPVGGRGRPEGRSGRLRCGGSLGILDAGVELARNLVRIPVVGAGQSVMHLGVQLSNRLGIVAYESSSLPFIRKNLHAWRVLDSVVGIEAVEIPLLDSTQNRTAMRNRFLEYRET